MFMVTRPHETQHLMNFELNENLRWMRDSLLLVLIPIITMTPISSTLDR